MLLEVTQLIEGPRKRHQILAPLNEYQHRNPSLLSPGNSQASPSKNPLCAINHWRYTFGPANTMKNGSGWHYSKEAARGTRAERNDKLGPARNQVSKQRAKSEQREPCRKQVITIEG